MPCYLSKVSIPQGMKMVYLSVLRVIAQIYYCGTSAYQFQGKMTQEAMRLL